MKMYFLKELLQKKLSQTQLQMLDPCSILNDSKIQKEAPPHLDECLEQHHFLIKMHFP